MVKLPEAIQRQVDEAEALERQMYQPEQGTETEVTPEQQAPEGEPEAAATPEPQTETVPPVQQSRRDDDAQYWRARFDTVQGMISAQSAQFTEQLRAANERVQALTGELARLQQEQQKPQQANDNDAETFGEDLVSAIDRRAAEKAQQLVSKEMQPLLNYIKQLEAKVGSVGEQVAATQQESFETRLARLVPDFEQINVDQGFLNWLGEVDPVYGVPRQAALDAAANQNSAERVAGIFNAYKSLTGKQVSEQQKTQVRQELERQTAPTSTRGAAQTPNQGKVWSVTEYERALDPRNIQTMGRAKADELAAEAERAYVEGRIRY